MVHHSLGIELFLHLRTAQEYLGQQSVAIFLCSIKSKTIHILNAGPPALKTKSQRIDRKLIGVLDAVEPFFLNGGNDLPVFNQHGCAIVRECARNFEWIFMDKI